MISFEENRFNLTNAFFRYVIGIDSNGKLYHCSFLPLELTGKIEQSMQRERLGHPFPFEIMVNTNFEPLQCPHGIRYFWPLSSYRAEYVCHEIESIPNGERLTVTLLDHETDLALQAVYEIFGNSPAIRRYTRVENRSDKVIAINHISSFVLSNFPYFSGKGSENDMYLHLFKSHWSWEGNHETRSYDSLGIYKKWCRNGFTIENNSTLPCQSYIPYFVIEERNSNVFWGIQIEHSGPWRFETGAADLGYDNWFYAQGGIGNDLHAHWCKTLQPGECFSSAPCAVTTACGSLSAIYNRMHAYQKNILIKHSEPDSILPVIYNDWQYMHGAVNEQKVLEQLDVLSECGVECYVMDAGWFTDPDTASPFASWWDMAGDWDYDPVRFPNGLSHIAEEIRKREMIPGIWCEIEAVGKYSKLYQNPSLLLRRGERFVEDVNRRFLYFGEDAGREYATSVFERLIGFGFRYFKIDYNIDSAPGCDNSGDSLGQGLYQHRLGYYRWLDDLRAAHPDIIIENCSSGGMRLEYGMLSRTDLASITDQESNRHTGNILLQVTKLIHPSQCGNWSSLSDRFDRNEYAFTLINSMMGRMQISGDIAHHSDEKREILKNAILFYKAYCEILIDPVIIYHTEDLPHEKNDGILAYEYRNIENTISVICVIRLDSEQSELALALENLRFDNCRMKTFPDDACVSISPVNHTVCGLRIRLDTKFSSAVIVLQVSSSG